MKVTINIVVLVIIIGLIVETMSAKNRYIPKFTVKSVGRKVKSGFPKVKSGLKKITLYTLVSAFGDVVIDKLRDFISNRKRDDGGDLDVAEPLIITRPQQKRQPKKNDNNRNIRLEISNMYDPDTLVEVDYEDDICSGCDYEV